MAKSAVRCCEWLFEFTDSEARDAVIKRDETTVHKLVQELATLHGPVSDTVVSHVEEALSKVKHWVQKNGNYEQLDPADALAIVPENACMRKYFKGIRCDEEDLDCKLSWQGKH